jgi:hypothetical protein
MKLNTRRLKQTILIGALIGGVLWALFIIALLGTEDFSKDVYLFMVVSFLLFLSTTAAISLALFYAIPTFIVYIALKHMAAKEYDPTQDNLKGRHTPIKLRYRFFTGLVFAAAAAIALPVFFLVIALFMKGGLLVKDVIGSVVFSAIFSIAAFFWGVLLTSRFRVSEDKKPLSFVITLFFWGCVITALTMFSTGFFLGIIESIRHTELPIKAFEYGLFIWGFGSVLTFGVVYVVGGAAGVLTGLCYRRVPHNKWLVQTPGIALPAS